MNAHSTNQDTAMLTPAGMSHYFPNDTLDAAEPSRRGLFARLGEAMRWLADFPHRRMVLDELSMLTEHELADIGLTRAELPRVFDPEFAARRVADRGSRRVGAYAAQG